jgi:hypothetical protein
MTQLQQQQQIGPAAAPRCHPALQINQTSPSLLAAAAAVRHLLQQQQHTQPNTLQQHTQQQSRAELQEQQMLLSLRLQPLLLLLMEGVGVVCKQQHRLTVSYCV